MHIHRRATKHIINTLVSSDACGALNACRKEASVDSELELDALPLEGVKSHLGIIVDSLMRDS